MDITEKAEKLEDRKLCDHCFGRQFARLGYGLENYERAWIIQEKLENGEKIDENDFERDNIPDREKNLTEDCQICGGMFRKIDEFVETVYKALERYEFNTYLIGTRPPSNVLKAEERLWEEVGLHFVEPVKSELNRLIGKKLEKRINESSERNVDVDFKRPDINAVLDIERMRVSLQINSMLIHGFYNKLSRKIPQTRWPCRVCKGEGCDECDWTGKKYQESVEEIVAELFIRATKGLESKFHGAGREDVDAKCLGKREFVLEIIEPEKRDIDLEDIQEKVNESDKVQIFGLEFCDKNMVETVKKRRANKTYRAEVRTAEEVPEERLEKLAEIKGTVKQKTPTRVEHRRADKTRKRKVFDISWEKTGENNLILEIKGEAGLYIKELISGDSSKTKPSVSEILGTETECTVLDVINIEKPAGYEDV